MDQFIDLCILCGCDYTSNIRGIGPVKALSLIQKHGTIEVRAAEERDSMEAGQRGWEAGEAGGGGRLLRARREPSLVLSPGVPRESPLLLHLYCRKSSPPWTLPSTPSPSPTLTR